jgi:hypothetical protein
MSKYFAQMSEHPTISIWFFVRRIGKPSFKKRVSAVSTVRNDWGIVLSQTSLQKPCWPSATKTKRRVRGPSCEHSNSFGPPRMRLRRSAIDTRWCISLDGRVEGGPSPPTDTRIASEPQRFLLGQVLCNPILKKGLDLPWALWVSRHHNLLFSPRPPLEPIRKKRHGCQTGSMFAQKGSEMARAALS